MAKYVCGSKGVGCWHGMACGNREEISTWEDRWLPQWGGRKIQDTPVDNSVSRLSELINQEYRCWNEEIITRLFSNRDATTIRCIPLASSRQYDPVVWTGDNSGEYLVKGGYRMLHNIQDY